MKRLAIDVLASMMLVGIVAAFASAAKPPWNPQTTSRTTRRSRSSHPRQTQMRR